MDRSEHQDDDDECSADGVLRRYGTEVSVGMTWHMSHALSREFQKDFLKLRCRALQEAFGDLKGVRGMVKNVGVNKQGEFQFDKEGNMVVHAEKVVHHPKSCQVAMGFMWPNVDDKKWIELKEKFKEVFVPAALHGGVSCDETDNKITISSLFELAEKGEH